MDTIPPLPTNWPEQKPYIGNVNQIGANNLIKEILAVEPHPSFRFVVCRILERLIEENRVLAFEETCAVPRLAWTTRNVMEMRVLSRYVCKSKANVERFQADLLTIGATTLRSAIRLHNDLAKQLGSQQVSPELHRNQGELQSARDKAGLAAESALLARKCAKQVGLEKEYLALSGVTSLLVHPSAVSILKIFDLECYREVISIHGLILVSKVILELREHIAKHGYKPAR